jgi:hypothetical protein
MSLPWSCRTAVGSRPFACSDRAACGSVPAPRRPERMEDRELIPTRKPCSTSCHKNQQQSSPRGRTYEERCHHGGRQLHRAGRALPVALGVGTGLAATPWAAHVKPPDSGSPSSPDSASSPSAPSASSPSSSRSATGGPPPRQVRRTPSVRAASSSSISRSVRRASIRGTSIETNSDGTSVTSREFQRRTARSRPSPALHPGDSPSK